MIDREEKMQRGSKGEEVRRGEGEIGSEKEEITKRE